jgi:hypothetical protein
MLEVGLYMNLLKGDLELYAAVLLTTCFGFIVRNRSIRTVTYSGQTLEVHTFLDEIVTYGISTFLGEALVELVLTGIIGVTLYLYDVVLVLNEDIGNLVEQRERLLLDSSLTGLELNTLHSFLEQLAYLTFEFGASFVLLETGYSRTCVFVIGYSVTIGIEFTTLVIYMAASLLRCARTLVDIIRYSISVAIFRTTLGVNGSTGFLRCAWALIKVIRYSVAVCIKRTTDGIDISVSVFRRTRTLIQIVRYSVSVRVNRATDAIYHSVSLFRGIRALVSVVLYTVTV